MTSLTDSINARAKRREGATAGPWFASELNVMGAFSVWRVVRGEEGNDTETVAEAESLVQTARHIADNDPTTVAALEAVALAAEEFIAAQESVSGYSDATYERLSLATNTLRSALDHLTATIGADDE